MAWERFAICSDIHGDKQDPSAVAAFLAFCRDYKPQHRILNGDLWDFAPLRGKADDHERSRSMREDFDAGLRFLSEFRPTVFVRGNHDERLWWLAARAKGILGDYAQQAVIDIERTLNKRKIVSTPYRKRENVYQLGSLKILHGFSCGKFAAKQTAEMYGTSVFGHTHAVTEFCIPRWPHGETAWNCGCLCDLNMDYAARQPGTLAQRHGWAYGVVDRRSGEFILHLAKEVGGKYVAAPEICWY